LLQVVAAELIPLVKNQAAVALVVIVHLLIKIWQQTLIQ
jgi:hypothetical protein